MHYSYEHCLFSSSSSSRSSFRIRINFLLLSFFIFFRRLNSTLERKLFVNISKLIDETTAKKIQPVHDNNFYLNAFSNATSTFASFPTFPLPPIFLFSSFNHPFAISKLPLLLSYCQSSRVLLYFLLFEIEIAVVGWEMVGRVCGLVSGS